MAKKPLDDAKPQDDTKPQDDAKPQDKPKTGTATHKEAKTIADGRRGPNPWN